MAFGWLFRSSSHGGPSTSTSTSSSYEPSSQLTPRKGDRRRKFPPSSPESTTARMSADEDDLRLAGMTSSCERQVSQLLGRRHSPHPHSSTRTVHHGGSSLYGSTVDDTSSTSLSFGSSSLPNTRMEREESYRKGLQILAQMGQTTEDAMRRHRGEMMARDLDGMTTTTIATTTFGTSGGRVIPSQHPSST